jgi:hypothetical protein
LWRISVNGGEDPLWRGDEIFFISGEALMTTPVKGGGEFAFESPKPLFSWSWSELRGFGGAEPYTRHYDVNEEGSQIVVIEPVSQIKASFTVVEAWIEDFAE